MMEAEPGKNRVGDESRRPRARRVLTKLWPSVEQRRAVMSAASAVFPHVRVLPGGEIVYRLGSRFDVLAPITLFGVVGAGFSLTNGGWLLGLLTVNGKPRPASNEDFFLAVSLLAMGLVALWIAWYLLLTSTYEVRIRPDGMAVFRAALGTTNVAISEIHRIEMSRVRFSESSWPTRNPWHDKQLVHTEGAEDRMIRITHAHGTIRVGAFSEMDSLIGELAGRNSSIFPKP